MKRIMMMVALAAFMVAALSVSAFPAFAGPDKDPDDGCTKSQGTWTCEYTDLPGNSDENGQGNQPEATVEDQTQGNKTNKSPEESQDLADNDCTQGSTGLCKQAERNNG
jgi:hypothetical protein